MRLGRDTLPSLPNMQLYTRQSDRRHLLPRRQGSRLLADILAPVAGEYRA